MLCVESSPPPGASPPRAKSHIALQRAATGTSVPEFSERICSDPFAKNGRTRAGRASVETTRPTTFPPSSSPIMPARLSRWKTSRALDGAIARRLPLGQAADPLSGPPAEHIQHPAARCRGSPAAQACSDILPAADSMHGIHPLRRRRPSRIARRGPA